MFHVSIIFCLRDHISL